MWEMAEEKRSAQKRKVVALFDLELDFRPSGPFADVLELLHQIFQVVRVMHDDKDLDWCIVSAGVV